MYLTFSFDTFAFVFIILSYIFSFSANMWSFLLLCLGGMISSYLSNSSLMTDLTREGLNFLIVSSVLFLSVNSCFLDLSWISWTFLMIFLNFLSYSIFFLMLGLHPDLSSSRQRMCLEYVYFSVLTMSLFLLYLLGIIKNINIWKIVNNKVKDSKRAECNSYNLYWECRIELIRDENWKNNQKRNMVSDKI